MHTILNISEETRKVIEALSAHYSTVMYIDIMTAQYEVIRISDFGHKIQSAYPDDLFNHYINTTIAPGYQDQFREFVSVATMPMRLAVTPSINMEFRSVTEGRQWCRATITAMGNDEHTHQVRYILLTFEDIHHAKAKDERLERQLRFINGLISCYSIVVIYNVLTDTCLYSQIADHSPKDTLQNEGTSLKTMFVNSLRNYCHPDYREIVKNYSDVEFVKQLLRNRKQYAYRFLSVDPSGRKDFIWIELCLIKFADAEEPAEEIAITFTNVDADECQKRAQQAALEDVKSIIRSSEMGVWHIALVQGKQPTMTADSKMLELLGIAPDNNLTPEQLYDAWFSRVTPEAIESVNESVMKILTNGRDENTYLWNHPRLGNRYVRCGGTAQPIMGGHMLSGYHYDVTDSVVAEMKNKEKLEDALASTREKSAFIHNMVHDIRNPLNAIMGFSQLLAMPDGSWTQKEKDEHYEQISSAYDMLSLLIDDVIDAADSEHGNYIVQKADFKLNGACRNVIKAFVFRKPANVNMYMTSEVDDSYTINSDSRRICQVLSNYLSNACKHTYAGEIRLHVSTTEHPGHITFSVTDTGEGIPAEMAEKIFKRFKKHNNKVKGSGIGLNICSVIASKLGAEVCLDTSYTRGARFLFIL